MKIKAIDSNEIKLVVRIHMDAFKGFFLTDLGESFLTTYYKSVLNHPYGILLGYFEGDTLLGFCAATKMSRGFNSRLVKANFVEYAFVGLRLLLKKPFAIVRLVKNFTKSDNAHTDECLYSELLSIGVASEAQGLGVGKKLLGELERRLKEYKVQKLSLTTDYEENEKVIGFYKANGYTIMYDFIAYPNRHMYRLIKSLNNY